VIVGDRNRETVMRCTRTQNVMLLVGIVAASCFSPLIGAQSTDEQAMRSKEAEALHTKAREVGASGDYAEWRFC
jgi:hypothetical protein